MSNSGISRISGAIARGTPRYSLESRVERLGKWMSSFESS